MPLIFIDGFDHYATAQLTQKWSAYNAFAVAAGGRRSTNRLYCSGAVATGEYCYKTFGTAMSNGVAGFSFSIGSLGSAIQLCSFSTTGTAHVSLWCSGSTGRLIICRGGNTFGSTGTVLAQTAEGTITAGTTYHVEVRFSIHDSTGSYEVKLDGVSVLSGTGADTQNGSPATWDRFYVGYGGAPSYSSQYGIDDVYLGYDDGDGFDLLGDCRVDTLYPNGAGNSADWTPSAGANYECVDEVSTDGDTTYVSTDTTTNLDLYAFTDLSHSPANIHAVQLVTAARKEDAGTVTIQPKSRVGGTTRDAGAAFGPTTSYAMNRVLLAQDPDTSSAWTQSGVNAAEFGVELA